MIKILALLAVLGNGVQTTVWETRHWISKLSELVPFSLSMECDQVDPGDEDSFE